MQYFLQTVHLKSLYKSTPHATFCSPDADLKPQTLSVQLLLANQYGSEPRVHTRTHTQAVHKAGKGDKLEGKLRPLCFQKVLFYFFHFSRAQAPDWPTVTEVPPLHCNCVCHQRVPNFPVWSWTSDDIAATISVFVCVCVSMLVCEIEN